jgi:glycosyltransferase involved in cell wall biosynthesis
MRIVYLSNAIIPSRTANSIHVMKMCQAFAKKGHKVVLIVPDRKKETERGVKDIFYYYNVDKCFEIKKLPFINPGDSRLLYIISTSLYCPFLLRGIAYLKPDVVYGRDIIGCYLAAFLGYSSIFESHRPVWSGRLESFVFSRLLKCESFDKLVVITEALKAEYLQSFPIESDKIKVAPDGSDGVTDLGQIEDWPGRKGVLQVGYVGHLYHGKGMEVVAALTRQMPEVDFHVIGGMERDITFWKNEVKSDNMFFHGFVPQNRVSRYINSLDVCLLPNQEKVLAYRSSDRPSRNISDYTSPLKLFDYMAHKKAIIASDLPVLREVLNETNALLVKHDDIKSWKGAINRLRDDRFRQKIGNAAYKDFRKNYNWDIRARNVLS